MSTSAPTVYPCDRGVPTGPRGWHHFEAGIGGVVVCRYCGRKPEPVLTTAPRGSLNLPPSREGVVEA